MLSILYFASVREAMGRAEEQLQLPKQVSTVAELMAYLEQQDPAFKALNESSRKLLVAVNQTITDTNYSLSEDDEVAFFPPMTGG